MIFYYLKLKMRISQNYSRTDTLFKQILTNSPEILTVYLEFHCPRKYVGFFYYIV